MDKLVDSIICSVKTGSSHGFILTSNVHDIVLPNNSNGPILGFRDRLCRDLSATNRIVYCYMLSRGYATYVKGAPYNQSDPEHRKIGEAITDAIGVSDTPSSLREDQDPNVVSSSGRSIKPKAWAQSAPTLQYNVLNLLENFEKLLYTQCNLEKLGIAGTALVIENADYLAPREGSTSIPVNQRIINETLMRWGYDRLIRKAGNIIVLLASEKGALAPDLTSPKSGYELFQVPFPDLESRKTLLSRVPGLDQKTCQDLASQSNGLRLADIEKLSGLYSAELDSDHIKEKKREVLEGLCRGVVELVEPRFDLSDSNAQPKVTDYLRKVAGLIRRDHSVPSEDKCAFIPKGLLFVGPPGNGKSHLTTAFAKQCGMTMVRFKNMRSMWVGETERNLENALEILPTLKPVVVFVDEIDQMLSARDMTGQASSHEVEQHVLARLLEFMGNDRYRGEILWIGATNRPDMLDAAMLRRFDRVIPFMNPTLQQIEGLVADLAKVLGLSLSGGSDKWETVYKLIESKNLSCDSIQKTVRHASELVALVEQNNGKTIAPSDVMNAVLDYIPNHDPRKYLFMCLHSLAAISFVSDIPWTEKSSVPGELQEFLEYDQQNKIIGVCREKIEDRLPRLI